MPAPAPIESLGKVFDLRLAAMPRDQKGAPLSSSRNSSCGAACAVINMDEDVMCSFWAGWLGRQRGLATR